MSMFMNYIPLEINVKFLANLNSEYILEQVLQREVGNLLPSSNISAQILRAQNNGLD